ncbi:MAG: M28 family peptidase, partial [Bdellovibrionaceae bacterium]|nr:M28 family peptidase [Pseudobdellovibrionaceae bacterium]
RKRLKHNILFAIWSGEEIGVLGATHFAQSWAKVNPGRKFGENFSGNLNLDMIGRLRDKLAMQGVGSSIGWKQIVEELATRSPFPIVTQDDPYLPTDSVAFFLAGTPAVSLFTGAHAEYHTPRDTPATVNYVGVAQITQFAHDVIERIAGPQPTAMPYESVPGSRTNLPGEGRTFRIYLGTVPDYTQEGVKGVRISGVTKDGPAEKAGLKGGDTIIEFDKMKIESIHDYVYSLQAVKPGKETSVIVSREGRPVELKIVPQLKE